MGPSKFSVISLNEYGALRYATDRIPVQEALYVGGTAVYAGRNHSKAASNGRYAEWKVRLVLLLLRSNTGSITICRSWLIINNL